MPLSRLVFAADIAGIAERVEPVQDHVVVRLAGARLAARRGGGDLHVADDRQQLSEAGQHVAVENLAMVDVELQFQTRQAEIADHGGGGVEIVQEIAGIVAKVERLDQHVDSLKRFDGEAQRRRDRRLRAAGRAESAMPASTWTALRPVASARILACASEARKASSAPAARRNRDRPPRSRRAAR